MVCYEVHSCTKTETIYGQFEAVLEGMQVLTISKWTLTQFQHTPYLRLNLSRQKELNFDENNS
jgi:hypothetical protein